MATISQQNLPLTSSDRLLGRRQATRLSTITGRGKATLGSGAQPQVRWGAAVVEPASGSQQASWKQVSSRVRRGRRTTVWVDDVLPKATQRPAPRKPRVVRELDPRPATRSVEAVEAGDSFARNRIRHAFELFGACMLIVTFLALAMFA
ncbi:MAG: hypothetical protein KAI24_20460 [Planctomycetes bacterium]|nr:hypothetical protein [Planctomycetota bacterium]